MTPGFKRTSVVWKYFTKVHEKTVTCNICNKNFKYCGGTTNIRVHLLRVHRIQFVKNNVPIQRVMSNNDLSSSSSFEVKIKEEKIDIDEMELTPQAETSNVNTCIELQLAPEKEQEIEDSTCMTIELSEERITEIDNALINMLTKDFQPISLVENRLFLEYSQALQPLYTPPTRKKILYEILPKQYAEATSTLRDILEDVKYVSLTIDIWTSDTTNVYITVTAHFVHKDALHSCVLATRELSDNQTGENVAITLKDIIREWKIENKIVTVVLDDRPDIINAIIDHLQIYPVPCVGYTLNLIVSDSLNSNEILRIILKKCKLLVEYFKENNVASDKLKSIQEQMHLPFLKVKQDVPTRWNSCYIMLRRLTELKDSFCVALTSFNNPPQFPTEEEWDIINDSLKVLKPVYDMTMIISSQSYPTLSMIIPLIHGFQHSLTNTDTETDVGKTLKSQLLENICQRFGGFEEVKIIAKTTFLDPRFKKLAFGVKENANAAEKWVNEELREISTQQMTISDVQCQFESEGVESSLNIWAHFDKKVSEINSYSSPMTTIKQYLEMDPLERHKDPLEFWAKHKFNFLELYDLALKYLSVPGTSVRSERMFTKAGELINLRRKQLSSKNLDQIIFLNSWF